MDLPHLVIAVPLGFFAVWLLVTCFRWWWNLPGPPLPPLEPEPSPETLDDVIGVGAPGRSCVARGHSGDGRFPRRTGPRPRGPLVTASASDILADLAEAQALVKRSGLRTSRPEAYLRDREHLAWLKLVTRDLGRDPFPSEALRSGTIGRLTGVPIFLDPTVAPNVLELRWPDGRVSQINLASRNVAEGRLARGQIARALGVDP